MSAAALRPNLAEVAEMMAFPNAVPNGEPLPFRNLKEPAYPHPIVATSASTLDNPLPSDLFRNPHALMPLITGGGFVVYFISAHGLTISSIDMPASGGTPYSVIQTGGGDATGCPFYFGSFKLLKNLFGLNLPYSFQYLLGLYNDRLPQVFRDLIYTTSDETGFVLPERQLSFSDKDKPEMGVFVFDPSEKKKDGDPLFERWSGIESLFTREDGTTLSEVIDTIMISHNRTEYSFLKRTNPRPAIFVVGSCANMSPSLNFNNRGRLISRCARCHYFSKTPGYGIPYYKFNESAGPQPNITKPKNVLTIEYTNFWHNLPPKKMLKYYSTMGKKTSNYLEKASSSGPVRSSGQRARWQAEKRKTLSGRNRLNRNRSRKNKRPLPPIEEYPVLPNYETPPSSQGEAVGGNGTGGNIF